MHHPKRWNIAPPHPLASDLAWKLRTSPLLAQVLLNRGFSEPAQCHEFLRPTLMLLHDPALLPNLELAADRIAKAIRDKEKIVIYGDYDVDGITATSILWHAITLLGGVVDYYIPHRLEEGYGLNTEAIAQICDQGAKLIVTVDCGVTAIEPARIAAVGGVDLIITDHHETHGDQSRTRAGAETQPELPPCLAIVHPRLPGRQPAYPNPYLCGAGIAFKLAWGIGKSVNGTAKVSDAFREFLLEATALAGLGTIADVVPLVGENRVIAHFGLGGLKASKLLGIRALIESAGLTGHKLDSYDVGFRLGPRLNACGRMGHARLAVEMLTQASAPKAVEIATYLETQNKQRQAIEKNILEQALAQIKQNHFDSDDSRGLVLAMEGWHAGVIGIVASRIVERYHRPTILVALTDGQGQGSGRSIPGFHLTHALEACRDQLDGFGGHEMAAGVRLRADRLGDFRDAFLRYAAGVLTAEQIIPELELEAVAELAQLTVPLVREMERMAPFGNGNRRPLLCCLGVEIAGPPRAVGKGEHLQIMVRQEGRLMKCIAFGYGDRIDDLVAGRKIDLAVEPTINEYNGNVNVELEVKDVRG